MPVEIIEVLPSSQECCDLHVDLGLFAKSLKAASMALPNSLYGACISENNTLIAMGRVGGDGACNFEVFDVALEGSYVSMIVDEPIFYEKLGYKLVAPKSQGMTKKFAPN